MPLVSAIAGRSGDIAAAALPWLRIAIFGVPAILISMAGNGWMRGVQDTVRPLRYVLVGFGVVGGAVPAAGLRLAGPAALGAGRFGGGQPGGAVAGRGCCSAGRCCAERVPLRLDSPVLRAQLVMGRDLVLRTLAFQACFVSAAAVAARFGAAALAAHQVVLQLWNFLALVLDSLAIAAQSLVGAALGAGRTGARQVGGVAGHRVLDDRRGGAGGRVRASARRCCRRCSPTTAAVLDAIGVPWWFMVAQLPIAGIVFALDGVLLGAGDAAFMRTATLVSALRRLPAADLAVAGVRLGPARHLVRA